MARRLSDGGLLAHCTGTIPGVAAHPLRGQGIIRLQRFKQRQGPFLLLAASRRMAASWVRYWTPALRRAMRAYWPGRTTLIFPARPGLPACCYQQGRAAMRVDASDSCRLLADAAGGLLLSSSLNRKGGSVARPSLQLRMRWHRHIHLCLAGGAGVGQSSRLLFFQSGKMRWMRK
ncbi:MAG: Sua5/YciO/YrdC/YwlC family protein [Mariprofundaceae bacterium]